MTALSFAVHYPARVSQLILFGAGLLPDMDRSAIPESLDVRNIMGVARTAGLDSMWKRLDQNPLFTSDQLTPGAAARLERMKRTYSGADVLKPPAPSGQTPLPTVSDLVRVKSPTLCC